MDNLICYEPIKQTETVFTQILEKLYKDVEFKKNITQLESGNEKEVKKATVIKKTICKLKVFGTAEQPLLLARDVGVLMGISNIKLHVKYYNKHEKVTGMYTQANGKITQTEFLTWKGVVRAASCSRSILSELFREFIYELIHQVIKTPELLNAVAENVIKNNRHLVEAAKYEFEQNYMKYKKMYELESKYRKELEQKYEDEVQKRLNIEQDKSVAELDIELQKIQLQIYNNSLKNYEEYLSDLIDNPSTPELELTYLKKKFMKPLYVYGINSSYYNSIKKTNDQFFNNIDNYTYKCDYFQKLKSAKIIPPYEYFYIILSTSQDQDYDKYFLLHTEWIVNKKHLELICEELDKTGDVYVYKKKSIYNLNIDELQDIIAQQMIAHL